MQEKNYFLLNSLEKTIHPFLQQKQFLHMVSLAAINVNLTCNLLLLLYWSMSSERILQELTNWFPEAQDEKLELMQKFTSQLQALPLRQFVTPQNNYSIIILLNIMMPFNFAVLFFRCHPLIWVQGSKSMVENLKEQIQVGLTILSPLQSKLLLFPSFNYLQRQTFQTSVDLKKPKTLQWHVKDLS